MFASQRLSQADSGDEFLDDKQEAKLPNLPPIDDKLKGNIEKLQQGFENAWIRYKERDFAIKYYRSTEDFSALAALELHVESLFYKFRGYKKIEDIRDDFTKLRNLWITDYNNKDKCNPSFFKGYLLILTLMEARFIESFIQNLSQQMSSLPSMSSSSDEEKKIDMDSIVKKEVRQYQENLEQRLFGNYYDEFKRELIPELNELHKKIGRFHLIRKRIIEHKAVDNIEEGEFVDVAENIRKLLQEERRFLKDAAWIGKLQVEREEVIQSRDSLFEKNKKAIYQFIERIEADQKTSELIIDINAIDEFKQKKQELKDIQNSINQIRIKHFMLPEQVIERNILTNLHAPIVEYEKRGGFFSKDKKAIATTIKEKWVRLFFKDKEAIDATIKTIQDGYSSLAGSNILLPLGKEVEKQAKLKIGKLLLLQASKSQELKELNELINHKVAQELSGIGISSLRERIISKKRAELLAYATAIPVETISHEILELRRKALNKAWDALFLIPNGLTLTEKALQELQIELSAVPVQDQQESNPTDKFTLLTNVQSEVLKRVQLHKSHLKKLETETSLIEEKKEAETTPLLQPKDRDLSYVKDPTLNESLLQKKNKKSWYSKLVDSPWKKALWGGLLACAIVVLALTGVGLIVELSVAAIAGIMVASFGVGMSAYFAKRLFTVMKHNQDSHSQQLEMADKIRDPMPTKTSSIRGSTVSFPFLSKVSPTDREKVEETQNINCFQRLFCCRSDSQVQNSEITASIVSRSTVRH